ncbi:MAG: hypothetical protein FWB85_03850 [Chitinispirillia bacterium]|nr:hypothetical protein [Chitinispirillia bacterium]MCL2241517.1 hypothetical protein [Chitinispirillia bacterium]
MASCIGFDGDAYVRFTWESSQQHKIDMIAASYNDVYDWWEDVYMSAEFDTESATDIPRYDGSPDLPNNIYSSTIGSAMNKGRYFPIAPGNYTAICSGEDQYGYWDIVANYTITINEGDFDGDGADQFFEIAFNVRGLNDYFHGTGGSWDWDMDVYDSRNTSPMLSKRKQVATSQIVKQGGTMDVTYYVIRRPKK